MAFRNEIALTGEQSEIGTSLRRNVDRSSRRGLELEGLATLGRGFALRGSASVSRDRIREWRQFYDVYDEAGELVGRDSRLYRNVRPLLTPAVIANLGLEWTRGRAVTAGLHGRYVGRSWLENTEQPGLETPDFFLLDGSLAVSLRRFVRRGEPRLRLEAYNLLDHRKVWPNGYSYSFLTRGAAGDTLGGTPYYFPQATRSVALLLDLKL
jgi:iron complex outermembrane receptor protein